MDSHRLESLFAEFVEANDDIDTVACGSLEAVRGPGEGALLQAAGRWLSAVNGSSFSDWRAHARWQVVRTRAGFCDRMRLELGTADASCTLQGLGPVQRRRGGG